MSADAETTIPRVESSAEEQAKAAVEIQVSGLILGNPVGFFVYEWYQLYCGFCMQVVSLRIIVVDLGKDSDASAGDVQRHYRGHRERRRLKGHGLSPDQRWSEVIIQVHRV